MRLNHRASAGTCESSDVLVTVEPLETGIELQLTSTVEQAFGAAIRASVLDVLNRHGVEACSVTIQDKGALDYVIRARMETALLRAQKEA